MIFIGYNINIGFPRYYDHHSKWTDSRAFPIFARRWWNKLKSKYPVLQIAEWVMAYRKPYCQKCMDIFIEDDSFLCFNGINNPTRQDRIKIVETLTGRFK
jgi:hypothetical protein